MKLKPKIEIFSTTGLGPIAWDRDSNTLNIHTPAHHEHHEHHNVRRNIHVEEGEAPTTKPDPRAAE